MRNRGVLLKINGGVEILSAIWWGKLDKVRQRIIIFVICA